MRRLICTAIAAAGGCLMDYMSPAAAATWTYVAVAPQTDTFTATFDAVPSAADQDTVVGLSQDLPSDYTSLAAIVRFNNTGQIDVRNGGGYSAAVSLNYAAQSKYHVRMVVNIPAHNYSVFVTPPGQAEVALASGYAFRSEQANASKLTYEDEGYSGGTVNVSDFAFATSPPPPPNCAFAAAAAAAGVGNDGCAGAGTGAPNHPSLLATYGSHRPPFDVAGVDYYVGVPAGPLKDPAQAPLPAGCNYGSRTVTCRQNDTTISGYDFSSGDIQLVVSGVTNVAITGNKFGLGGCVDPLLTVNAGGSIEISHNSLDGAGGLCNGLLAWGTLLSGSYSNGASVTIEYNTFTNIPVDAGQFRGPGSGAASIVERYNLFYLQGWFGHPDGIQLNGGNFDPIDYEFNTYYSTSPPTGDAGTQPVHIEAQLTATITNATVAHNTVLTPGNCQGGRNFPSGCTANFDIACKRDYQWSGDYNSNFSAFGNYIDWSGTIAALLNPSGNCTNTHWGSPFPNIDLSTGATLNP